MNRAKKRLKILITAGATREPIDPVRFISNYATGFLGSVIAQEAKKRGHQVCLIAAPSLQVKPKNIEIINVETCRQMQQAVERRFSWCDCLMMSAAVSDFRPERAAKKKIKRQGRKELILRLKPNPDILQTISRRKGKKLLVGFALESENLKANAQAKLRQKKLDLIVATQINANSYPFGPARINALILHPPARPKQLTGVSKRRLSRILLDSIEKIVLS